VSNTPTDTAPKLEPSQWLDRYGDGLFRYALSRLRNREAAEEVVQETFVSALKARDQYSGRGSENGWLVGILKRKIIDYVRRRNRLLSGTDDDSQADLSETLFDQTGRWREDPRLFGRDPAAGMESKEFRAALNDCLTGLSEKQRNVFTLREIEDISSDLICKELDITPSNLWVLLHRARLRLASCLRSKWQSEETVA
jgi:RNA polymerase sigma-70 factor (TIGR02943 family)